MRLLKVREVQDLICLSRTEIYNRIGRGEFPLPVKAGSRAILFRSTDIDAWIESLQPAEDLRVDGC